MKRWRKVLLIVATMSLITTMLVPKVRAEEAMQEDKSEALVTQLQDFAESVRPLISKSEENTIYSPFSFYLALMAIEPGLTNEEQTDLREIIIPDEVAREDFYPFLAEWLADGMAGEQPNFLTETLVLGDEAFEWNEDYTAQVEGLLTVALSVNFQDAETYASLNDRIAELTNDLIKPYFSDNRINELTSNTYLRLMVLNVLYFNANWQHTFSPDATTQETFYGRAEETMVDMMQQSERFAYIETDDYQAIRMNYRNQSSFLVVLPLEETSTETMWQYYQDALVGDYEWEVQEVDLSLPKWESSASLNLTDALTLLNLDHFQNDLGETEFFTNDEELFISQILQRIEFKLDEEGTEATAVTEIAIETTSAPIETEEPVVMTVDRPFTYGILFKNVPLFEGAVTDLGE